MSRLKSKLGIISFYLFIYLFLVFKIKPSKFNSFLSPRTSILAFFCKRFSLDFCKSFSLTFQKGLLKCGARHEFPSLSVAGSLRLISAITFHPHIATSLKKTLFLVVFRTFLPKLSTQLCNRGLRRRSLVSLPLEQLFVIVFFFLNNGTGTDNCFHLHQRIRCFGFLF